MQSTPNSKLELDFFSAADASTSGNGQTYLTTATITTDGACAWTAASNASWIAITGATSGTGNATVAFTAKGAASGPPMTMRYTLERKGTRWVVKEKSETGNPHGVGATAPPANLPPGHPVFPIPKK